MPGAATTNYGFPKPQLYESPNGPQQIGDLADALDTAVYAVDSQMAGLYAGGKVAIATSQPRTNVAYGKLATPDELQGIVLPADSLLAIFYQATWRESVANAAAAAIFLNNNQLVIAPSAYGSSDSGPVVTSASLGASGPPATDRPLVTSSDGLFSAQAAAIGQYTGDVTTGQVQGFQGTGGPCYVFAAAGTYDVSVQFKASSGTVTVKNRRLWVRVIPFL